MKLKTFWMTLLVISSLGLTGCQTAPAHAHEKKAPIKEASKKPAEKSKEQDQQTIPSPKEQKNLWQRIAMQLNIPVPENQSIEYYRNWYIKHPNHLKTISKRAEPFLYMITVEVENRELPLELVLFPIIESSFDPFAYSYASAAGLWQFVPGTADRFNLERNWWYDGRRDVPAATNAALDYMEYFEHRFNGDWQHAMASYNSGGGRVSSAIRKNKKLGKSTDFFSLDLPKETSSYVPKLLALADLIKNHEKYGVELPYIPNKQVLDVVDPKKQLDLAIAAQFSGIAIEELQSYNPGYSQWATAPEGPYHLLLPVDKIEKFNQNLKKNGNNTIKVMRYKVQSGDTISQLAVKHNTTSKIIRQTNNLDGNNIRIGQYLLIPTASKGNTTYALSAPERLKKIQNRSNGQYKIIHEVKNGESLWLIAKNNHVSTDKLAQWNGMAPNDTLKMGQKLIIWKKNNDNGILRKISYTIRNGDSLSTIGEKFSVSTANIIKWNNISKNKYIQPGQSLTLYVDVTKVDT